MGVQTYNYVNLGFLDKELGSFRRDIVTTLNRVDEFREKAGNEQFFRTVWRYPSEDYETDASEGRALAPMHFDLDNQDLEKARKGALNLVSYLLDIVPENVLRVYFSGNKGFHLEIPSEAFDLRRKLSDEKAPFAFKNFARDLKQDVAGDIDLAVYEPKRLWRVVNSRHEKSGLYKVPITTSELELLSAEEIRGIAQEPRNDIYAERGEVSPVFELVELYDELREREETDSIKEKGEVEEVEAEAPEEPIIDELAPCIESLLEGVEEGMRNHAAIRIASALCNIGYSREEAKDELEKWNQRNAEPLPKHELEDTLNSAYRNRYNYGCKDFILNEFCDREECPVVEG